LYFCLAIEYLVQRHAGRRLGRHDRPEYVIYFDEWLADAQGRPLSPSLPFQAGNAPHLGQAVQNYFDNLLPDSDVIRRRIA